MDSSFVAQLLASGLVASVVGAVVNGIINRKKLGAEATEIITKAASGVVERLEDELARLREDKVALRQRIADLETEQYMARTTLQLHAAWDHMAVAALAAAGISDLPQPPPLSPPPASRAAPDGDDRPSL